VVEEPAITPFSARLRAQALVASLIVLFCSGSVRLFVNLRSDPNELVVRYSDAPTYLGPATSLIEQGALLDSNGKPMIHRTPGYPIFLAGTILLTGRNLRTVLIAQTIILSFGPVILYWLARRVLPPETAIIAGLIAAFSPWGAVLAGLPMSDGLFLLLITVLFWLMKITADSEGSRTLVGAAGVGWLTGVAVLVRPIWPLVILAPVALCFGFGLKRQGAWFVLAISTVCAVAPVALWRVRNQTEAHFNGMSDIPGQTAWQYLAARVRAGVEGQDRQAMSTLASQEEDAWGFQPWSQELDNERWRRANAVFREHPFRTGYSFTRSAFEHMIHPSPDVLEPARLNFYGDIVVLACLWGGLLFASVCAFWQPSSGPDWDGGHIDQRWLLIILVICMALTLSSGISFGAGSRLRAPLEAIVPLLAAAGLVRISREFYGAATDRNM
jgi:4-amino-4-deoxy-L-arabinose transferase-like glycosyltransferase